MQRTEVGDDAEEEDLLTMQNNGNLQRGSIQSLREDALTLGMKVLG